MVTENIMCSNIPKEPKFLCMDTREQSEDKSLDKTLPFNCYSYVRPLYFKSAWKHLFSLYLKQGLVEVNLCCTCPICPSVKINTNLPYASKKA